MPCGLGKRGPSPGGTGTGLLYGREGVVRALRAPGGPVGGKKKKKKKKTV